MAMKRIPSFSLNSLLFASLVVLLACEDKINPKLESAAPIMAVDAWINNKLETQTIILTTTQGYFDNTLPPVIKGAAVTVEDDHQTVYLFKEDDKKPGYYTWTPAGGVPFGTVGYKYKLSIHVNGETFEAATTMGRVPPVDSITFDKTRRISSKDSIVRAEFWATDPVGAGDAYFIRSYKNGVLLNKPSEINIAYDAGFSPGGVTDGVVFITPIRRGINSNDEEDNGNPKSPIAPGDSMNVQIHSISAQAFTYLNQVTVQTDRPGGFQELFARPLANVSTNISNVKTDGAKVVGFFNVASVSSGGKRYKKK
jgi:hypothetical protein